MRIVERIQNSCRPTSLSWLVIVNPHLDATESIIEPSFAENRPPVVEKDFERPPHRHPAANNQALRQHCRERVLSHQMHENPPRKEKHAEKCQTDAEADQTATDKLVQAY